MEQDLFDALQVRFVSTFFTYGVWVRGAKWRWENHGHEDDSRAAYSYMTPAEYLCFCGEIAGMPAKGQWAQELL